MADTANLVSLFCHAAAADLRLLADLNAVELTEERIKELQAQQFPDSLGLSLLHADAPAVAEQLRTLLKSWQPTIPSKEFDALACDFASIYLNGSLHSYPSESVWIDDEELICQQPMFDVRECYEKHDLVVPNWRVMADDHLVNELLFVSALLEKAANTDEPLALLKEAAWFMDEHLLRWLLPFGRRVAQRCATPFYASLAVLTALYGEQVRDHLADILETPRRSHEEIEVEIKARRRVQVTPIKPMPYVPGVAPSW
ncbi:TorD/DmsD family molecular chaperone [Thiolinea disciformis]|uniref:TorD/DmsD family molecular chaperone n=1 Tax=Thiolinea disciformis TaxID=125614 RepID=UPI00038269ED|nr:molecular chaperone TorD family protein [Thiolinea disciformis]